MESWNHSIWQRKIYYILCRIEREKDRYKIVERGEEGCWARTESATISIYWKILVSLWKLFGLIEILWGFYFCKSIFIWFLWNILKYFSWNCFHWKLFCLHYYLHAKLLCLTLCFLIFQVHILIEKTSFLSVETLGICHSFGACFLELILSWVIWL